MLRPGNASDRNRAPGLPGIPATRSANQSNPAGQAYVSHGAYGPNGLYRAHGERAGGHGFAGGQTANRVPSAIAGRAFGDPPAQLPDAPIKARLSGNAGFGAEAGTFSRYGIGASAAATGAADLSRWGGIRHQGSASAEEGRVRTPELQLLVVDEDDSVRSLCAQTASSMGFNVAGVSSIAAARSILKHQTIDLLLIDLKLPGGGDGLALVEEIKTNHPQTAIVITTAQPTVESAVESIRIGAGDYLTKPFVLADLTSVFERVGESRQFDIESRLLRERLRTPNGMGDMIGRSPEMEKLYRILSKVTHSNHPVLILGESGTGKELVARSIHVNRPNAKKPFVPVDCGTLVSTLIESELFGYVKGAFTGANKSKEGLLASADGGTVFLDEIGELPLDLQAKLLRALQEKEVRPVGSNHSVPISARVLAATNRDLATMVEQGRFRKDLYFRLNVVNLRIPPLRDRRDDIPVLAMHFLEKMKKEKGVDYTFSNESLRTMTQFDWPGNVRELEHAIERACTYSSGPLLHMADMPSQLQEFHLNGQRKNAEAALEASRLVPQIISQRDPAGEPIVSIAEMEKNAILGTIERLDGDKLMAAKLLGIGKTTLYRKLKEYGVAEEGD